MVRNITAGRCAVFPCRIARMSMSAELTRFSAAHGLEKPEGDPLAALKHLSSVIYGAFEYEQGVTQVHSPIEHPLAAGRGVCQDFAHIMIAIARSWGIPARYVSGYM